MKVLVTGGAGFIGSNIVDGCLAAGYDVAVLDNLHTGKRENVAPAAQLHEVDLRDAVAVEALIRKEQPEVIFHEAALANVRESVEKPQAYAENNIVGSINLLEAARKHGVRKIIYASTGGACYGEPEHLPVTEDHPINPLDPYGTSKHTVEHYLFLYKHNYGLDYTVLRYPNVYGPRQDPFGEAGVIAIFTHKMLAGEDCVINGTGKQERDFMYVGDIVQANLLAVDKGSGGIYNIGWGRPTNINEVFAALRDAIGYEKEAIYGPAKLGEVYRVYLDSSKAQRELGWQPEVPLNEGIKRTVDFFRS